MNTRYFSIFSIMALALLTLSACSNDDVLTDELSAPAVPQATGSEGFVAAIGDQLEMLGEENLDGTPVAATRSTMSEGVLASWATSDKISICDGTLMYVYQPEEGKINGASCSFVSKTSSSFATDKEGTFYAFYPADAVSAWNGSTVTTMIYTEQDYSENCENSGVMGPYMAATASTTNGGSSASFTFGHICSVIDVDFSSFDGGEVESVALYANSQVNIAGKMTYDASGKTATLISNDKDIYYSDKRSDVVLVSDIKLTKPSTVRFFILPVKTAGFTITVRTSDGNCYSKSSKENVGLSDANDYITSISGADGTLCKPYYKRYNFGIISSAKKNRWMAMIPGSTYFSMLSTPGSHDSATSSVSSSYTSSAKCQSETIAEQLENGVRAFDLRPQYCSNSTITADNLTIYHGSVTTGVLYKNAIAAIVSFLEKNPTETVTIIMAKESASGSDQTDAMVTAINSIHSTYSSYFKVLDHSYYTLKDYRGKIFYGCRPAQNITGAVRVTSWPDDASVTNYGVGVGDVCYASVEDAYNTSGDSKKTVVNALLNLASANTNNKYFHFTFTSVAWSLFGSDISTHANTQNPAAVTYINSLTGPTGYVYGDYMGSSSYSGSTLLKAIIAQNFKYVYKNRSRCSATTASGTDTGADIHSDEYADDGTVYSRRQ